MIGALKALRVDLVDVLGARWPRREPAGVGLDLDAAERLIVAGRPGPDRADRIAGQFLDVELLRPQRFQRGLLLRRRRDVDALIERHAELCSQFGKQLAGIAAGVRDHLRRQQPHDEAVLVGGPGRAVALEERRAGAFPKILSISPRNESSKAA